MRISLSISMIQFIYYIIMIVLIIERLKNWYEEQLFDQQQGFRQARGTTDGIFLIKSVQQITNRMENV